MKPWHRAVPAVACALLARCALGADCPTRLEGGVFDSKGTPQAGLFVTATADGRVHAQIAGAGGFQFNDLPPGTYELCVENAPGTVTTRTCYGSIDLACGGWRQLTFRFADPELTFIGPIHPTPSPTCPDCGADSTSSLRKILGLWRSPCGRVAIYKTSAGDLQAQTFAAGESPITSWSETALCVCGDRVRFRSSPLGEDCPVRAREFRLASDPAGELALSPVSASGVPVTFRRERFPCGPAPLPAQPDSSHE